MVTAILRTAETGSAAKRKGSTAVIVSRIAPVLHLELARTTRAVSPTARARSAGLTVVVGSAGPVKENARKVFAIQERGVPPLKSPGAAPALVRNVSVP